MSASTQNQALNALLFLYKEILERKIGLIQGVVRANRPKRLPVVLTKKEVKRVLDCLHDAPWLMAMILYGAGLRLLECCHLRVKDIDFAHAQIVVRAGNGNKDRYTMLPAAIVESLRKHLLAVKHQHSEDLARGFGRVALPDVLERKYPNGGKSGDGNGSFRLRGIMFTGRAENIADITFTKRSYKRLSRKQESRQASSNRLVATLCVTRLQPICSKTGMTSERCRSCLDIMMSVPRSTRMF